MQKYALSLVQTYNRYKYDIEDLVKKHKIHYFVSVRLSGMATSNTWFIVTSIMALILANTIHLSST